MNRRELLGKSARVAPLLLMADLGSLVVDALAESSPSKQRSLKDRLVELANGLIGSSTTDSLMYDNVRKHRKINRDPSGLPGSTVYTEDYGFDGHYIGTAYVMSPHGNNSVQIVADGVAYSFDINKVPKKPSQVIAVPDTYHAGDEITGRSSTYNLGGNKALEQSAIGLLDAALTVVEQLKRGTASDSLNPALSAYSAAVDSFRPLIQR